MEASSSKPLSEIYNDVRRDYVQAQGGPDESQAFIRSHLRKPLAAANTFENDMLDRWLVELENDTESIEDTSHMENAPPIDPALLVFTRYSSELEASDPLELTCTTDEVRELHKKFPEHPRYEACTPSDHNLGYRASDANHPTASVAQHLPYADTADEPPPGVVTTPFQARQYLKDFGDAVDWECLRSPDFEAVRYYFVLRACTQFGISLADVDEYLLGKGQPSGSETLQRFAQRDPPTWADQNTEKDRQLLSNILSPDQLPEDHIRAGAQNICRLCKTYFCLRHTDKYYTCKEPGCVSKLCQGHDNHVQERGFIARDVAKHTADEIRARAEDHPSCGPACFMTMTQGELASARQDLRDDPWSDDDRDHLLFVLRSHGPDSSPCDVGRIVGQSCIEIWLLRAAFIGEGTLTFQAMAEEEDRSETGHDITEWEDDNRGVRLLAIPRPCNHVGSCAQSEDCVCRRARFHCTSSCRCASDCHMRWQGCDCSQRGISCRNNIQCPCAEGNRECEANICTGCGPGSSLRSCRNMELQVGKRPRLEVKTGQHGLGAFALEHIRNRQFIGEYTTEVNIHELDDFRDQLRNHIQLNYTYTTVLLGDNGQTPKKKKNGENKESGSVSVKLGELNPFYSYDAARVGNAMRYMNDTWPKKRNNVGASYLFSQGEMHIAMFALRPIKVREELFLEYGKPYWEHLKMLKNKPVVTDNNDDADDEYVEE